MINDFTNMITQITEIQTINYDWWGFGVKLFIAIMLWIVLKSYYKLKKDINNKIIVANEISHVRIYNTYRNMLRYNNSNFDEKYFEHEFKKLIKKEREIVCENVLDKVDISKYKLQKMLNKYYHFKID